MRPMALRHVFGNCGVTVGCGTAGMGGDALAAVEYFDGAGGVTGFELLTGELVGNAVIVPVDFDVIIDIGSDCLPFGHHIALGR